MRIVLDTNVVLTGLRSRRGAGRIWVRAALLREYVLLATPAVFFEYEDVLKRPGNLEAIRLDVERVEAFLDGLASVVVPVNVSFLWRPQLPDPNDEMILEAAVNGRADWIVTYNVRHYEKAVERFGVGVGEPGALLPYLGL